MKKVVPFLTALFAIITCHGIIASGQPKKLAYGRVPGPLALTTRNGKLDRINEKYEYGRLTYQDVVKAIKQLKETAAQKQARLEIEIQKDAEQAERRRQEEIRMDEYRRERFRQQQEYFKELERRSQEQECRLKEFREEQEAQELKRIMLAQAEVEKYFDEIGYDKVKAFLLDLSKRGYNPPHVRECMSFAQQYLQKIKEQKECNKRTPAQDK